MGVYLSYLWDSWGSIRGLESALQLGVNELGEHGHFGGPTINIGKVEGIIETLGQFGLPIWVTEFDWSGNSNDHKEHAVQLENFYRLMFSLTQVGRRIRWMRQVIR